MVVSITGRQVKAGAIVAKPLLADMVDLGVGVEADTSDAIEQLGPVDGPPTSNAPWIRSNEPVCSETSPKGFSVGTLADEVENAAGRSCAVQDRGRPGDHLGTLEKIGINTRRAERPALQPQSVQVRFDGEPAGAYILEAEIGIVAEIDAGRIAEGHRGGSARAEHPFRRG